MNKQKIISLIENRVADIKSTMNENLHLPGKDIDRMTGEIDGYMFVLEKLNEC